MLGLLAASRLGSAAGRSAIMQVFFKLLAITSLIPQRVARPIGEAVRGEAKRCQQKGGRVKGYWLDLFRNWRPAPAVLCGANDQVKGQVRSPRDPSVIGEGLLSSVVSRRRSCCQVRSGRGEERWEEGARGRENERKTDKRQRRTNGGGGDETYGWDKNSPSYLEEVRRIEVD